MAGSVVGFVGVAALVTILLLALSHATTSALAGDGGDEGGDRDDGGDEGGDRDDGGDEGGDRDDSKRAQATVSCERGPGSHALDRARAGVERDLAPDFGPDDERSQSEPEPSADEDHEGDPLASLSTRALLANVALSQGLLGVVLVGAALYMQVPPAALGVAFSREYLLTGVAFGTAVGLGLALANELGAAGATRLGIAPDERLRESLAPEDARGWIVLLGLVLPIVAAFEELLFRAALIGAVEAGFGVSPWLLAVGSSVAFALGHGLQGPAGVLVTGALGLALATAFVLTGSLLVVVLAHYLVNAIEFVVHEGLGPEWGERAERGTRGERAEQVDRDDEIPGS